MKSWSTPHIIGGKRKEENGTRDSPSKVANRGIRVAKYAAAYFAKF